MSCALRVFVPLNSRCSRKWLEPLIAGASSREPASTQTPSDTERTPGIRSVTTRRPDVYSVRWIVMMRSALLGGRRVRALAARLIAEPTAARLVAAATAARRSRRRSRSPPRPPRSPPPRPPRSSRGRRSPPPPFGSVPSGTSHSCPTGFRLILPCASMSSTSTVSLSPSLHGLLDALQALAAPELRDVDQAVAARARGSRTPRTWSSSRPCRRRSRPRGPGAGWRSRRSCAPLGRRPRHPSSSR